MKIIEKNMCAILILISLNFSVSNAQVIEDVNLVKLDPGIRYGKLENGFRYYIKHLPNAEEKIDMRFYLKTGVFHQNRNQLDFAHALEHMAFKCAKHFPENLLNDPKILSRFGMTKGDIFGQTAALYTWYSFDIPSMNTDATDMGLLWFRDISDLKLSEEKINAERGPLRQEIIYRNGDDLKGFFLDKRLDSELFPCLPDYTDFFDHNQNFSTASLMEFYNEWYIPDRMVVVIVGNISDLDGLEKKVKRRFSDIEGHLPPKVRPDCRLDYLKGNARFVVLHREIDDKDNESVEFHLYFRDKSIMEQQRTWKGLKHGAIWDMLNKMINDRFRELSKEYNTSFSAASDFPTMDIPAFRIRISDRKDQEQVALEKAIRTLLQVKIYGFTSMEWERMKKASLKTIKCVNSTKSSYWMEQIQDHFVNGELLPKNKTERIYNWLSTLSLTDFNTLSRQYLSAIPDDIGIISPKEKSFKEAEVRGWLEQGLVKEVIPYTVPEVPKQLMGADEISALKEVGFKDKGESESGVRTLVLGNGVKVVLDTLNRNTDMLYLHGFSPKGASCFSREDYFSAINGPEIVQNAGVGDLDKFVLGRFLERTSFRQGMHPYIDYFETGIKGNAKLEELEMLLQLVYLYFTQPRKDKIAYEDWKSREKENYLNPFYSLIQEDFDVAIREFLGDSTISPQGTKRFQGIPKTEMDRAYAIYQRLFRNAKDFTFLISGNFSVDKVLPLLQKYLGNLPNTPYSISCPTNVSTKKGLPKGSIFQKFSLKEIGATYEMKNVKYELKYLAMVDRPQDWKEQIKMEALGFLMNSKIQDLRFSKDASLYLMMAMAEYKRGSMSYDFKMILDCVPSELEVLRKECKQMILDVKRNSFKEKRFEEVIKTRFLNKYIGKSKSTFQKLQQIYLSLVFKEPLIGPLRKQEYIKSLTPKDIQEMAQKYLKDEYSMEFVMRNSNQNL